MNYSKVQVQFGGDLDMLDLVVLEKPVKENLLVQFQFELVPWFVCMYMRVLMHMYSLFIEEI